MQSASSTLAELDRAGVGTLTRSGRDATVITVLRRTAPAAQLLLLLVSGCDPCALHVRIADLGFSLLPHCVRGGGVESDL